MSRLFSHSGQVYMQSVYSSTVESQCPNFSYPNKFIRIPKSKSSMCKYG